MRWLWYTLAWVPALIIYAMAAATRPEVSIYQGLASGVVVMGAAALLGLLVWRLSGWLTEQRSRWVLIVTHAIAALLYSAIWLSVMGGWIYLVAGRSSARLFTAESGPWQLMTGIYLYGVIAGFSYLLRTRRLLREREVAIAHAEAAAARAQLQSVRAQLNPHFLFNALHAVSALVRTDPGAADRAIERLGDLLRRSLDHGQRDFIPLGQEWELVRGYIELEQLRLGDRLRIRAELEPLALDVPVPPLVLQPLVENAVKHGIVDKLGGGTITIRGTRRNGTLELLVSDDGRGARAPNTGGFGLAGVRKQIEGRYGARASMSVDPDAAAGFTVTLRLPVEPEA